MSCTPDDESMEETDACFIVRERQRAGAGVEFAEAHPALLCTSLSADNVMQITG